MECSPSECNSALDGNKWLQWDGLKADRSQLEIVCAWGRIAAGNSLHLEFDLIETVIEISGGCLQISSIGRWSLAGYGLWPVLNWPQVLADRKLISGNWSWKNDDNQSPFPFWWYWGYVKLYHFWDHEFHVKQHNVNGMQICMYTMYQLHGSAEYDTEHYSVQYSEHYSEMPNYTAGYLSYIPNMTPNQFLSHTAAMLILYIVRPYESSLWWSNNPEREGWKCRNCNNTYR